MEQQNNLQVQDTAVEYKKKSVRQRLKLAAIFSVVLVIMSALVVWLIFSGFKTNYKQIKAQTYELVTGQVIASIESSIRYGKDISHYYGMDETFESMAKFLPEDMNVYIVGTASNVLYKSAAAPDLNTAVRKSPAMTQMLSGANGTKMTSAEFEGGVLSYLTAIYDEDGTAVGGMVLLHNETSFSGVFSGQLKRLVITTVIAVAVCFVLLFLLVLVVPGRKDGKGLKLMLYISTGLVIAAVLMQGLFGYLGLRKEYEKTMVECGTGIADYIGIQIEQVHEKGVEYERMNTLSAFLSERIQNASLMWNMQLIYKVASTDEMLLRESDNIIYIPITTGDAEQTGYQICFQLSDEYMNSMMTGLFLTFAITLIVMLVMLGEVGKFPQLWIKQSVGGTDTLTGRGTQLRLLAFLFYTANYISLPYSAASIRASGDAIFGLTTAMTASLPLTMEIAATLIGMLVFQWLFKRSKNILVVITGFGCLVLGNVFSYFAAGQAVSLILARMVCGLGLAGVKMFFNKVVALEQGAELQNSVGQMNIGLLGGIMCGGSLGAVVAESLGISGTFLCTVGLAVFLFVLMRFVLPGVYSLKDENASGKTGFLKLFRDGRTLLYLLAVILPLNFGIMFIVSFVPAYVDIKGASALVTSYSFIVNGVAGIYIGSSLVKMALKKLTNRTSLIIMLCLALAAMLVLSSPIYLVIAVMLSSMILGVFDTFGNPVSSGGFLELPAVQKVPVAAALMMLSVFGSLIQTVSPLIYNFIIAGMEKSSAFTALLPVMIMLVADAVLVMLLKRGGKEKTNAVGA